MKQYAFLLMGMDYDPARHQVKFETNGMVTYLCTVRNVEEAKAKVLEFAQQGVGAIELCGAFGPELARELMKITNNRVAIGYVVHDPDQDHLFSSFFS